MFLVFWRIALLSLNVGCVVILLDNLRKYRKTWEINTRDYWATLFLWSLAGVEIAGQGLVEHSPFSARLIVVTLASLATPIALRQKHLQHKRDGY